MQKRVGELRVPTGKGHAVFCPQTGNDCEGFIEPLQALAHAGERKTVGRMFQFKLTCSETEDEPPLTHKIHRVAILANTAECR
jgi:hypothetical protein